MKLFLTIFVISLIAINAEDFRISFGDWSYLFNHARLNWSDSAAVCKQNGMNLISINNPVQLKNALTIIKHNNLHLTREEFWTSGTDAGHENIFVWTANQQLFDFVPWHPGQPDSNGDEDCVILTPWHNNTDYRLNDDGCHKKFLFICSKEKETADAEFRTNLDETSYLITFQKQTWYRASLICKQKGMELVSVDSEKKLYSVLQIIQQSGRNAMSDDYWTSGTDLGSENNFSWTSSGEYFDYQLWHRGQPDNANNNQNCVELSNWNNIYKFNDQSCDDKRFFICSSVKIDVYCQSIV